MPIEVLTIIQGVSFALNATKCLGIIQDSLAAKLDLLADSEFEAGVRALRQASESDGEQQSLLREARSRLNKAVCLEKGLRLALAHIGLTFCHWHLGDHANARQALRELLLVKPPAVPRVATVVERVVSPLECALILAPGGPLNDGIHRAAVGAVTRLKQEVVGEQRKLSELQQSVYDCLWDV